MELQLDEVNAPAKTAGAERAHTGRRKVRLTHMEISFMAEMDVEMTLDTDDCSKSPGTHVLGMINGRTGVVLIRRDDTTGIMMAYAKGASWPAAMVEVVGRVTDTRWRP